MQLKKNSSYTIMKKSTKRLGLFLSLFLLSILTFSSCLKDGKDTVVLPVPTGKIPYDVIEHEIQDSLRANGFEINEGIEPPNVEGCYLISPMNLHYASDDYHNDFYDLTFRFFGQHIRGRLNYQEKQNDEAFGQSIMANAIGEGNKFSVYSIQTIEGKNNSGQILWSCTVATVVSGEKDSTGIVNCQYAYVLKDKSARNDYYLLRLPEINTFRIWNDGDSLANLTNF